MFPLEVQAVRQTKSQPASPDPERKSFKIDKHIGYISLYDNRIRYMSVCVSVPPFFLKKTSYKIDFRLSVHPSLCPYVLVSPVLPSTHPPKDGKDRKEYERTRKAGSERKVLERGRVASNSRTCISFLRAAMFKFDELKEKRV